MKQVAKDLFRLAIAQQTSASSSSVTGLSRQRTTRGSSNICWRQLCFCVLTSDTSFGRKNFA